MISEEVVELLSERLVNRIEEVNSFVLETIGNRIKKIGTLTPTDAKKLVSTLKYGGDIEAITNKLAEVTELAVDDIYEIFDEVAKTNLEFAKDFYEYRDIGYVPYEENVILQQQVKALANKTVEDFVNLTNTLGFVTRDVNGRVQYNSVAETYRNALDESVLSVIQGKGTFQENMYKTIKELGSSGIKTVNYESKYSRRLDSSVRQNILEGIKTVTNETQKIIGEELGTDGIEISVHLNPAPDHADIQGQQYTNEEFEELNNSLDRPIGTLNCYHYIFTIILGISKPQYTQEQLDKINADNKKGFKIDGEKYTLYEGQQMQRKLETKIREQKDIQIMAKASGNKRLISNAQNNITKLTNKYKELSDVSGLPTKMERLRVSGYRRTKV